MEFHANLAAAWLSFLLGVVGGMALGLGFHHDDNLGGYASWKRRLLRLGHVSFFGLGAINLAFYLTADRIGADATTLGVLGGMRTASWAFLVGAVSMPLMCALAAVRKGFRHGFVLPVTAVSLGVVLTLREVIAS